MNALKKNIMPQKRELELLAGGGGIERVPPRPWLSVIFGFLLSKKSDLTLESWRRLEQKRGYHNREPLERNNYQRIHWHF